jgi:hypothetical protein
LQAHLPQGGRGGASAASQDGPQHQDDDLGPGGLRELGTEDFQDREDTIGGRFCSVENHFGVRDVVSV